MDETIVPQDAAFNIELPSFEGPLDLLLHLIRKHELEILDLPIAFVTQRYLEYLDLMRELDLDVASEYLLMAATLAHIKSRSLLPPDPNEVEDDDEEFMEDPRAELIRRLLEYQKYKEVAETLGSRAVAGRDVFGRGLPSPTAEGEAPLAETSLFKLLDAFEAILKRAKGKVALEVTAERISIQERMSEITEDLRTKRACTFEELFVGEDFTRYDVVVTLLALLEMTKMHVVRLYQAEASAPLHIQYALFAADAPTIPPPGEQATSSGELRAPPMVALEDELKTVDDELSPDALGEGGYDDDDDDEPADPVAGEDDGDDGDDGDDDDDDDGDDDDADHGDDDGDDDDDDGDDDDDEDDDDD